MADSWAVKYRPKKYEDLVGNNKQGKIIKEAILRGEMPAAVFFAGTRGSGKTSLARLSASTLMCEHLTPEGNPCGECDSCKDIEAGRHPDVIEIDAASENSVQGIRELIKTISYLPTHGKYKVVIIDEVHSLSQQAANALLKTLEEPPEFVRFVFCTTEPLKVLDTIRSRCLMFTFHDITSRDIVKRLQHIADIEGVNIDELALKFIAKHANGGMRDAVMLLEQVALVKPKGELIKSSDVQDLVGFVSIAEIQKLFVALKQGTVNDVLAWLDTNYFAPIDILTSSINFLETVIFIKQGVSPSAFVSKDQISGIMSLASAISFNETMLLFKEFRQTIYDLRSLAVVNTATLFRLRLLEIVSKLNSEVAKPDSANVVIQQQQESFFQKLKTEYSLIRIPIPA